MSNHYPQRQITEIQLRYVTINQTLTSFLLFKSAQTHFGVLSAKRFFSFCTSKRRFYYERKKFKSSLWVLHSVLFSRYRPLPLYSQPQSTAGTAEQTAKLTQSNDSDAPAIESSDAQNACASTLPARDQPDSSFREFCNYSVEPVSILPNMLSISALYSSSYRFLGYIGSTHNKS